MSVSMIKHGANEPGYPSPVDSPVATIVSSSPSANTASQHDISPGLPLLPPAPAPHGLRPFERTQGLTQRAYATAGHEDAHVRRAKRAVADTPAKPPRETLGALGLPTSHSTDADKALQAELIPKMTEVADSSVTVPARSLISKPFEIYRQVVNQPEVLAWLRGKGFSLDSVTIGNNSVSGFVTRNGVVSRQTYTLQDTCGWWQVSTRVRDALEALDPTHHGVPYVAADSRQVSRNVASLFYGVEPAHLQSPSGTSVTSLGAGWPSLSTTQTRERELRLEWAKRGINERDDRENLARALQRAAGDGAETTPLLLADIDFNLSLTHPLRNDDDARRGLNELFELPEVRDALAGLGASLAGQPTRISEGRLQVLKRAPSQWLDVPVGEGWSQATQDKLAAVVGLSEGFGNALYSDGRHDVRQVARSMNLGVIETAGQARAAAKWLSTDFAPPASAGNYAKLLPQQWASGALSAHDKATLAALATDQKFGANTIGIQLGRRIVTQVDPQETAAEADEIWGQLLNTPEAQAWGRELAQALGGYAGAGDEHVAAMERQSLVTAAIMLSVDPAVPATPGTAAGYPFYAAANMGREMGAVRKDFETYLVQKKGVSLRAAPLVAHLFLAHAAPEFLVKPDPQQSDSVPEQLRLSADKIRIGSPAWMTLSLGVALAEAWGGAGASRGMSAQELGALTTLQAVQPQQQALAVGLGAKVVLEVGVMTGTVTQRVGGQYTAADYQVASDAVVRRSALVEQAIETLGAAPPTRSSLAIKALKQHFPELTDNELESLTLHKPSTRFTVIGTGVNTKRPTLVEAYATGDLHQGWFGFSHPRITQAEFDARIKLLPKIADQVSGAVDHYLESVKAVMPSLMKMSLANLPLEDRQALELGEAEVFGLRQQTGETQPQDAAKGNKVGRNRGWHGVLLRSKHKGKTRYHEFFPMSGTLVDRTADLAGKTLKLDGVIETEREYFTRKPSKLHRFLRGTRQPFDINAYLTGDAPRHGVSSNVIISRLGRLPAAPDAPGQGDADDGVPDTFGSARSQAIIDAILKGNYIGNYSGHRKELVDYANAVLPSEQTVSGYINRLMTQENGRAMVSMISFIGPLVDIYDGNVEDGLKGLAIDSVSLIGTGGLQATYKAWKAVRLASRLNRQAFRVSIFKEGSALLRGIFNPAEGFLDLTQQPGKFAHFVSRRYRGVPTNVGMGVLVPADVFEKARFGKDAVPTVYEMLRKANSVPTPSVRGVLDQARVQAIRVGANWYAADPRTGLPLGPPLQGFVPDTA